MIIRDALYGDIDIKEQIIMDIISSYEFQRLRKVKQLGLTYLLFPSAEHTRFSHSVGVFHLASKVVDIIESKIGMQFDNDEKMAFVIACLLHDIGHGAFSHTSEEVFNLNHESYSIKIIEDKTTHINKILRAYNEDIIKQVTAFIKKKHDNKILVSAISSTIDIDRMDYLMRDSYFAGVVYGNFDVDRILTLIDIEDDQMVFLEKGVKTLEDFIMSRYYMFAQVYLNDKTIKYEAVAKAILKRAKKLYEEGYVFSCDIMRLVPFMSGKKPSVQDYILMHDLYLLELFDAFRYEEDEELCYLAYAFILQTPFKDKDTYEYKFKTDQINKVLYKETVKIKREDGSLVNLEDISPLVNFLKNDMLIKADAMDVYV